MSGDIAMPADCGYEQAGLDSYLVRCYRSLSFTRPTPIQFYSIRAYRQQARSMVAQSKSGTGKTLSYISIILTHLLAAAPPGHQCSYLVVLPTRELALQVYQNFREIAASFALVKHEDEAERASRQRLRQVRLLMTIGGIPFEDDRKKYQQSGGNVVVGTIGRVLEFVDKKLIRPSELRMIVLDEGDKLFECRNKRFGELLSQVMSAREGSGYKVEFLLFSATYSDKLLREITHKRQFVFVQTLVDPQGQLQARVVEDTADLQVSESGEPETARDSIINLDNIKKYRLVARCEGSSYFSAKMAALQQLLRELAYQRCLVFVEKKTLLEQINERLIASQLDALLIHGSLSQSARIKLMNQVNQARIILASDLLARGIDIELDLVILFDAKHNDTFWHRIGRTGRYDKMGVAVSLDDIEGWQDYCKEEVQEHLDRIAATFDKGKEWYGKYLTEIGTWNETTIEKEIALEQEYRYFDEEKRPKAQERKKKQQSPAT